MERSLRKASRKRSPLFAVGAGALFAASACGAPDELASAPPTAEQVAIAFPGAMSQSASTASVGETSQALVGQTSELYQITYATAAVVNAGTLSLLAILHYIVTLPPSAETSDSRTWGPYTPGGLDPLTYRAEVHKIAPKHFTFAIDARPKTSTSDGDFVPLLDGEITKGAADGTGRGTMTLHYDNRRALVPSQCESGAIAFAFDNTGATATNDVMFDQFGTVNPANKPCGQLPPTSSVYHYSQDAQGDGDFQFTTFANVNRPEENKPALETLDMRSRWQATGAGRSDVQISGGDVATDLAAAGIQQGYVSATQCWDGAFQTVYETSSPAQLNLIATDGDASKCVF